MRRILLLLGMLLLLTTGVFAAEGVITDMKTDCLVDTGGHCQITQTVTIEVTGIENELQFPLPENAKKASLAGFDTSKTTQDGCTILTLKNSAGFSGSRTFTLIYTVPGKITEENHVQTLELPLLCPHWDYPVQHYAFTVTMPKPFETAPSFVSGYIGEAVEDYMDVKLRDTIVDGYFLEPLKDHESLSLFLKLDGGYFSGSYAVWSSDWTSVALVLLLSLAALVYWLVKLRSPRLRRTARSLPPDAALPCDLPYLIGQGRADFNMLVCHWGALGYLAIHMDPKGNVTLHRRVEMGNERRKLERRLFDALFAQSDVCDGASLVYKRTAAAAISAVPRFWNRRLYDRRSGNPAIMELLACLVSAVVLLESMSVLLPRLPLRWLLIFLSFVLGGVLGAVAQYAPKAWFLGKKAQFAASAAVIVLLLVTAKAADMFSQMLLAMALAVLTGFVTRHGGKRTEQGNQIVSQAVGFRKFLVRVSRTHLQTMLHRDSQYFYTLLPYAESIGLGRLLAEKLGDTELESCDWFFEERESPNRATAFRERLREALAMLELSIRN